MWDLDYGLVAPSVVEEESLDPEKGACGRSRPSSADAHQKIETMAIDSRLHKPQSPHSGSLTTRHHEKTTSAVAADPMA